MKRVTKILRNGVMVVAALIVLAAGAGWVWLARTLPETEGTLEVAGLKAEVTVERDAHGVPRIRAQNLDDLLLAQGFVMAQDRLWQMDVMRRAAAGELSEIFGNGTVELDREQRVLGLRAAAERDAAATSAETRRILEAYARGVNAYIAARRGPRLHRGRRLPMEFTVLRYEPREWRPADSLLIGAYMYKELTSTWRAELNRAAVTARVGPERARELFVTESALDHFVVGAELKGRLAQARGQGHVKAASSMTLRTGPSRRPSAEWSARLGGRPIPTTKVAGYFHSPLRGLERGTGELDHEGAVAGSNNWVVAGSRTYSGKPLLANDTHLLLNLPCIWYVVQLTSPEYNAKGFALPGGPLVVIGQNERIAWGFTNNGADVQDLYAETFASEESNEYRDAEGWKAAEVRRETIRVKGGADVNVDVVATRHGPVVDRNGKIGFALQWTATEPGGLDFGYPRLGFAKNWMEFREILRTVTGPAQNAVYADVEGNIGFIVAAKIPVRGVGDGSVPLPGDAVENAWRGSIPFDELPRVLNPAEGVIATANAKVAGPGYKHFLTDRWVAPYRTHRIYQRLGMLGAAKPEDFAAIQVDILSMPHATLARHLLRAAAVSKPKDVRASALLERLTGWDGQAKADSPATSFVEFARRALMRKLLEPVLGGELQLYSWYRSNIFLENVLERRPAEWLPKGFANYDELLMACADEAVRQMAEQSGEDKAEEWVWGRFMTLEMLHPFGRSGILKRVFSIGPVAQNGAGNTVKQTGRSFGAPMRFVADLSDPDKSLMTIAAGESGQILSGHYKDQFGAWYEGRGLASAFTDGAWEKARVKRMRMAPAGR